MPSLAVAKSPSKVFPMVSVRIMVPAMKATPRTTARPVSTKRTLWAQRPLMVRLNMAIYLPKLFMRSRTDSAVGCVELVDDAAVGEEDDAVGVARRHGVVGDHHDRLAQLADGLAHEGEDLGAGAAVEVAGGLVGEHDLGPAGEGTGHGHALLLATGELARAGARAGRSRPTVSIDEVEPLAVGLAAGQVHRERDVLDGREGRHQVERLEDEAEPVAAQLGELAVVEAS